MAGSAVIGILKALLTADTASYVTGLKQAETATTKTEKSIGGLGKEVAKLTPQADRMVKAFSGDKLLYQANNLLAAVEKIGGAGKLTRAEMDRTNATLTQAVEKYKALGQSAPSALLTLEKATRKLQQPTEDLNASTGFLSRGLQGVGKDILTTAAGFFTAQAAFSALSAGAHALVDEIKTLSIHGAAVGDVAENFERLTAQSGRLGSTLIGVLRDGTHGTIDDFTLMKTVNQDLTAGLNLTDKQFSTLAKGAFALAQATGGDVATGLDTMNDAMVTGRTRALALLTGKIDLTAAEEKFAKAIGTTREHLSEEGKLEAARAGILDAVAAATQRLGVQTDGLDERMAQAQAAWANFQNELGKTIATSPVIMAGLDDLGEVLRKSFGADQGALIAAIAKKVDDLAIAFVDLAKIGVESAGGVVKGWYAIEKVLGDSIQIIDGVRLAWLYLSRQANSGLPMWKTLDDQIGSLLVTMSDRGKALQAADKAQAGVDSTTKVYLKTLDDMVAKMTAARAAANAHTEAVTAGANATGTAGEADQRRNAYLKEATDNLKALTAAHDRAFGLDKIKEATLMVSAIGGMAGVAKMDAEQIKNLNHLLDVAIDASKRNGQSISLDWFRIEDATRSAADGLQEYVKLQKEMGNVPREEPAPLEPLPNGGLDAERIRRALLRVVPSAKHDIVEQVDGVGKDIKERLGRAFEDIPHFITSSILHSGNFVNGLKALGVSMADAIVEPLIKQIGAKMAAAKFASSLANVFGAGTAATALSLGTASAAAAGTVGAEVAGTAAATTAAVGGGAAAGGGLGATLAGLATNPITIAAAAGIGGLLLFKYLHNTTNKDRDRFLAQFAGFDPPNRPKDSNPPGFYGADVYLSKYKHHDWFSRVVSAKNPSELKTAESPIVSFMSSMGRSIKSFSLGGFIPPGVVMPAIVHGGPFGEDIIPRKMAGGSIGAPSINLTIENHHHISAIDGPSVDRLVRSPEYLRSMSKVFEHNKDFITTHIVRAQRGLT